MRRARVTYQGAFHHSMNRGYDGLSIFNKRKEKEKFLELLIDISKTNRIRIFAYCLMNNHYHLVLENSSGKMSNFFKQLNGQYASWYRQKNKGRGYVFQDRYKSFLIQDDSYLKNALGYVLTNPVRAKLVKNFLEYPWSSADLYFKEKTQGWIDYNFVEELFGAFSKFKKEINQSINQELPLVTTRVGQIIGSEEYSEKAMQKFNRRHRQENTSEFKRKDDYEFDPVAKVYQEFKNIYGIDGDKIDTSTHEGKRLRGNLLVHLKDRAGLKYIEIITIPIFTGLKVHSLGRLYKDAKFRMKKEK